MDLIANSFSVRTTKSNNNNNETVTKMMNYRISPQLCMIKPPSLGILHSDLVYIIVYPRTKFFILLSLNLGQRGDQIESNLKGPSHQKRFR